jgi:hypothetical protein
MGNDIRDKTYVSHHDVINLNFVRSPGSYVFRRHYRNGLRSHIMEVLNPADVELEASGIFRDGIRWFPKAKPLKMLRIFRAKFNCLEDALDERIRLHVVERYLAPQFMATSCEFYVDYVMQGQREIVLCGLQEYMEGTEIDPWASTDGNYAGELFDGCQSGSGEFVEKERTLFIRRLKTSTADFVFRIKMMIAKEGHVPDLAGKGNLLVSAHGDIKLVDINNISKIGKGTHIPQDDRGYPVFDKSIEALSLLEQKLVGCDLDHDEPIYKICFVPERVATVNEMAQSPRFS